MLVVHQSRPCFGNLLANDTDIHIGFVYCIDSSCCNKNCIDCGDESISSCPRGQKARCKPKVFVLWRISYFINIIYGFYRL